MVHAATHLENNMCSRVEETSGIKNKGKKRVLDEVLLW